MALRLHNNSVPDTTLSQLTKAEEIVLDLTSILEKVINSLKYPTAIHQIVNLLLESQLLTEKKL